MSLKTLPEIKADLCIGSARFDVRPEALERWSPEVKAAAEGDASISIYDQIGLDPWSGEGVTAKRIGAALRSMGSRDVTVNVNSPGGDFFEGVAIYNLLRDYPGKVTVRVMGLAASAASVIAMAGDEILMGDGAFFMIHNAWAVAVGNRNDMREAADLLEPFDAAMAQVYAARTGMTEKQIAKMMDTETWLGSDQAVDMGFATGLMGSGEVATDTNARTEKRALAMVEAAMAKAGYSRTQRREAFKALFDGKPGAADEVKPSADTEAAVTAQHDDAAEALQHLMNKISRKE
jgi:ATP-dependent protease ClpP protease subunit